MMRSNINRENSLSATAVNPDRRGPQVFKKNVVKNTAIIGLNRDSLDLYRRILRYPALGYRVNGFVVLQKNLNGKTDIVNILGEIYALKKVLLEHEISEILIAIRPVEKQHLTKIIQIARELNVRYLIVTDLKEEYYGHIIRDVLADVLEKSDFGFRRLLDFLGSVFLMVLLFPMFLIISFAIKLESRGPIFYSQLRVGFKGREFKIYKFRSMVQDAEKISGPVWAQKDDPRITKVGRFMRKTRIDELPQLINIFAGDMSFVGPRPERPFFVDAFKQQIPLYANRHQVKPGVTGWAQVRWRYDETIEDVKEKLRYDLYYVNNRKSIFLNFKILLFTVNTVLLGKGQ